MPAGFGGVCVTRHGRVWRPGTGELRQAASGGAERLLEQRNERARLVAASESAVRDESAARAAVEESGRQVAVGETAREEAAVALRRALREVEEAAEAVRRAEWLIERRAEAPDEGPDAVRRAELAAELRAEQRMAENSAREHAERVGRAAALRRRIERDDALAAAAERAAAVLDAVGGAVGQRLAGLESEGQRGAQAGEETVGGAARMRARGGRAAGAAAGHLRVRDRVRGGRSAGARRGCGGHRPAHRGGRQAGARRRAGARSPCRTSGAAELEARIERLARRREQLGPVNPLAAHEYEEAVAHVEELESQRQDLEGALAELQGLIRETDRRIRESFEETFEAAARNFEEVVAHLFPGGRGRLRLVAPDQGPRPVLGGEPAGQDEEPAGEDTADAEPADRPAASEPGVEVEVTPAGKSTKRLSLLSGGEKSLVALAFMFAVFLARPCPFYILDEVEAALDDLNIDRFLQLVRRYSDRAQFIVVTHQKRTMDAADCLYGVSMGGDGISRVVSRKLAPAEAARPERARGRLRRAGHGSRRRVEWRAMAREWSDLFELGEAAPAPTGADGAGRPTATSAGGASSPGCART